ncbi:hypothetical protein DFJ73DRAFT_773967 [Zopfochytrium polystomum]|nr:hypothetical protein DFJ73DRAFT_773967 [Zopfochytrium polystomum]
MEKPASSDVPRTSTGTTSTGTSDVPPPSTATSETPPTSTATTAVPPPSTGTSQSPSTSTASSEVPPTSTGTSEIPPTSAASSPTITTPHKHSDDSKYTHDQFADRERFHGDKFTNESAHSDDDSKHSDDDQQRERRHSGDGKDADSQHGADRRHPVVNSNHLNKAHHHHAHDDRHSLDFLSSIKSPATASRSKAIAYNVSNTDAFFSAIKASGIPNISKAHSDDVCKTFTGFDQDADVTQSLIDLLALLKNCDHVALNQWFYTYIEDILAQ